jgi:hypothetical protein
MQIFILGPTKSGKSTLAKVFKEKQYHIYEAGSWARTEYNKIYPQYQDEFSVEFKESLTKFALDKLQQNPLYSFQQYLTSCAKITSTKVIVGVRNPDDFINMFLQDSQNKVIFIDSQKVSHGTLGTFEKGLHVIEEYVKWKMDMSNILVTHIHEQDINNHLKILTSLKEINE